MKRGNHCLFCMLTLDTTESLLRQFRLRISTADDDQPFTVSSQCYGTQRAASSEASLKCVRRVT